MTKKVKGYTAASKICGRGACFCGYEVCANPSCQTPNPIPPIGKDKECPLARFGVPATPAPKTREEIVASWMDRPTRTDLRTLCSVCSHLETDKDGYVTDACYFDHCLDCPVNKVKESMDEIEAEAHANLY